ncbi:hypothetical protein [Parapedobacter sp. 10938]|uniref:hypothetical protein n=1 Tax=Parapedobacter flavus TaxID=3110225 RepID=UPI002DB9F2FB|nr:hypothetical protein [Parapedobacter sp. 10938]MEC3881810.1 hypothetical protein [Parapedobacter sp. 10938]
MKKKKYNEEEANKRFDEKYGNSANPDRNPLYNPDGDDFTDALFESPKKQWPGPDTTLEHRLEDVTMPVAVSDTVTKLTEANNIDELVDHMMLISGDEDAETKLKNITSLLSPDEQKHAYYLLDMAFGYDYDGESLNSASMAQTFQLDKIYEGEGAITFNLTEDEIEANEIFPETLSKPVELSFYDLDAGTYDDLVAYRKDPQNAPKPNIPEDFLAGIPDNIDGHAIDREKLVRTGKFQPAGSDTYYQIGSTKEPFEILSHETIERIQPGQPTRKVRFNNATFAERPKEPKMIPSEIKFQDGSAVHLTTNQGMDIINGKTVKVMHHKNRVEVFISYKPGSKSGVTVKVSQPKQQENKTIKAQRPKHRF